MAIRENIWFKNCSWNQKAIAILRFFSNFLYILSIFPIQNMTLQWGGQTTSKWPQTFSVTFLWYLCMGKKVPTQNSKKVEKWNTLIQSCDLECAKAITTGCHRSGSRKKLSTIPVHVKRFPRLRLHTSTIHSNTSNALFPDLASPISVINLITRLGSRHFCLCIRAP